MGLASQLRARFASVCFVAAVASAAPGQSEGSTPASRRAPVARDRYGSSRPASLERIRSVFAALDGNGDGRVTWPEARAAGFDSFRFDDLDLDNDRILESEEFELAYGLELRRRGQSLDGAVQARVEELERTAVARRWRLPKDPREDRMPERIPEARETRPRQDRVRDPEPVRDPGSLPIPRQRYVPPTPLPPRPSPPGEPPRRSEPPKSRPGKPSR